MVAITLAVIFVCWQVLRLVGHPEWENVGSAAVFLAFFVWMLRIAKRHS